MLSQPNPASEEVNSVHKAAAVLNVIAARSDAGARLTDIIEATGLRRATAHRLCRTLLSLGWITQPQDRQRYYLCNGLSALTSLVGSRHRLAAAGAAALDRVAEVTGDTAFLFLCDGLDAVCVDRREGTFPVKSLLVEVGARRPLGLGAAGLAILAFMPNDDTRRLMDLLIGYRPDCRARGRSRIENDLMVARRLGYAEYDAGLVAGVSGIGVPIVAPSGCPVGAISVAGVENRWPEHRRRAFADVLHKEAYETRQRLFD